MLGRLGPDEGLLLFTFSTGSGPECHHIGDVLIRLASTVITHFIGWTYQAAGPENAPAVAIMICQAINEGIALIEWELARRYSCKASADPEIYDSYRSLTAYTEERLITGLDNYRNPIDSGGWDMKFTKGKLRFSSNKGRWIEHDSAALWQPH